jgi:hypothetical protein
MESLLNKKTLLPVMVAIGILGLSVGAGLKHGLGRGFEELGWCTLIAVAVWWVFGEKTSRSST